MNLTITVSYVLLAATLAPTHSQYKQGHFEPCPALYSCQLHTGNLVTLCNHVFHSSYQGFQKPLKHDPNLPFHALLGSPNMHLCYCQKGPSAVSRPVSPIRPQPTELPTVALQPQAALGSLLRALTPTHPLGTSQMPFRVLLLSFGPRRQVWLAHPSAFHLPSLTTRGGEGGCACIPA